MYDGHFVARWIRRESNLTLKLKLLSVCVGLLSLGANLAVYVIFRVAAVSVNQIIIIMSY